MPVRPKMFASKHTMPPPRDLSLLSCNKVPPNSDDSCFAMGPAVPDPDDTITTAPLPCSTRTLKKSAGSLWWQMLHFLITL